MMGIFDAINMTHYDIEPNYPLIFSFLSYTTTNTFVFPFSFMTITLQDVATILGLPIFGDEITSLFELPFKDLGVLSIDPPMATFISSQLI